eukprot:6479508-Amphidinium_carterae.1
MVVTGGAAEVVSRATSSSTCSRQRAAKAIWHVCEGDSFSHHDLRQNVGVTKSHGLLRELESVVV